MSTLLADLTRPELDALIAEVEHAERKAHIALSNCPLDHAKLAGACGVAQDVMALMMDCYDESMLRWAAEFDRILDLGGDNDPQEWTP
jgi:hypothetical protein